MLRLLTSPLRSWEFIAGYSLPMIAIGFVQALACYAAGIMLGLPIRIYIFPAVMGLFPTILLYTALGLLFGTVLSEKAVGGICGALLTNLSGWLSGTWFSVEMIGGTFEAICKRLPFHAAAASARLLYAGQWQNSLRPLGITALWSLAVILASVWVFTAHIKKDNR